MRKWRRRQTRQARHGERVWPAYLLVAGTGFEPMIFGFATDGRSVALDKCRRSRRSRGEAALTRPRRAPMTSPSRPPT